MNIKPLGNRILVEVIPASSFSDGGILLLDQHVMNNIWKGRVLAKGNKVGSKLEVGDIVLFEGVYGKEVNEEETQRILDVGCLLAIEQQQLA